MQFHKTVFGHHFNDIPEKSVAEIAAKIREFGAESFTMKLFDGARLMAAAGFDGGLSPRTLDEVASLYCAFKDQGVILIPYGVGLGKDVGAEAQMAIEVGRRCGNVVELDLEPYDMFWEINRNGIVPYSQAIVGAGVSLRVDLDTRPSGTTPFGSANLKTVFGLASVVSSQCYFNWFDQLRAQAGASARGATTFPTSATGYAGGTGWVDVAIDYLKGMGVPPNKRGIIIDCGGWRQFGDAMIACELRNTAHLGLWVYQKAKNEDRWAFSAIRGVDTIVNPVPGTPPSTVVQECPDTQGTFAQAESVRDVAADLGVLKDQLVNITSQLADLSTQARTAADAIAATHGEGDAK